MTIPTTQRHFFAEIALDKKCYRLIEAVASSEKEARELVRHTLGIALIARTDSRAKRGVKSRLFRDMKEWTRMLGRHSLTKKQVDCMIMAATR